MIARRFVDFVARRWVSGCLAAGGIAGFGSLSGFECFGRRGR